MTEHVYVAPRNPFLKLQFTQDGKGVRLQFKNGKLDLTQDPEMAAFIDAQIAKKPELSALINKVNRDVALRLAEAHFAATRPQAVKGGANSGNTTEALFAAMPQSQRFIGDMAPSNPEAAAEIEKLLGKDMAILETAKPITL